MSKFKVGDRVVMTKDRDSAQKGMKGTIVATMECSDWGVRFDEKFDGGHDLRGKCETGYGHWIAPDEMEIFEEPKYEVGQIYRVDGNPEMGAIIKVISVRGDAIDVKAIRGNPALCGFNADSKAARSLTLLTGPQIGEAIRKYDADHAEKKIGVKEVKRRAEVGEYIKIVKAFCAFGYENGDILLVTRIRSSNSVICKDVEICVCNSEYVVLEGYKPGQKEGRRKAKAGNTIKVLRDNGGRVYAGTIWKVKSVRSDGYLSIVNDAIGGGYTWSCAADNYIVLSSEKHSYTAEQIAKAKKLCGEMVVEAFDNAHTFNLRILDKNYHQSDSTVNIAIDKFSVGGEPSLSGTATCSDHDEYNVWIGRCVALCKALHKPIPAFIVGD